MRSTTDSSTASKSQCGLKVYVARNTPVECAYPSPAATFLFARAFPPHSRFEAKNDSSGDGEVASPANCVDFRSSLFPIGA
jgi:hypothetical protein